MKRFIPILFISIVPRFSFAFERTVKGVSKWIIDLFSGFLMPLLFTIALTWFIWGVAEFIRNAENSDARKKGKQKMLWGIIALFVMVTFLGITTIFTQTLFNDRPFLPQLFINN